MTSPMSSLISSSVPLVEAWPMADEGLASGTCVWCLHVLSRGNIFLVNNCSINSGWMECQVLSLLSAPGLARLWPWKAWKWLKCTRMWDTRRERGTCLRDSLVGLKFPHIFPRKSHTHEIEEEDALYTPRSRATRMAEGYNHWCPIWQADRARTSCQEGPEKQHLVQLYQETHKILSEACRTRQGS